MVKDIKLVFVKGLGSKIVPSDNVHAPLWKKTSLIWDLPYWKVLEVQNAIDMMHLMKNLYMNMLVFLGTYGKIKDTP
jgi:hypothetical protein